MTKYIGQLHKMTAIEETPVRYAFVLKQEGALAEVPAVNDLLGSTIALEFTGQKNCINCQRSITKTFNQGYCFPCVKKLAACDLCVLKPDTCHFDKGTCREPEWAKTHCFSSHIVYLANSSGIKVGLTRETNVTNRWIDQGALQSLPIMRLKSRYQAGLIESLFAKHVNDKTDWRKMLQKHEGIEDLIAKRDELFSVLAPKIQEIAGRFNFGDIEILTAEKVHNFIYPVLEYPQKIKSFCFDKTALIKDKLMGVKGQYLIFESGVINVRKYAGYQIALQL